MSLSTLPKTSLKAHKAASTSPSCCPTKYVSNKEFWNGQPNMTEVVTTYASARRQVVERQKAAFGPWAAIEDRSANPVVAGELRGGITGRGRPAA